MQESGQATDEKESFDQLISKSEQVKFEAPEISVKSLFDAGAHYGHNRSVWHPKTRDFIYDFVGGIAVINLDIAVQLWEKAKKFLTDKTSVGARVLFVATKDISRPFVKEAAKACGEFYCVTRWLGGTLTNFSTIKRSIEKLNSLEQLVQKAKDRSEDIWLAKKEILRIQREIEKLNNYLDGIREMRDIPGVLVLFDVFKDQTALKEAVKLQIPVVALVDTNINPSLINYPIPVNDDNPKVIELLAKGMAAAVLAGKEEYSKRSRKKLA